MAKFKAFNGGKLSQAAEEIVRDAFYEAFPSEIECCYSIQKDVDYWDETEFYGDTERFYDDMEAEFISNIESEPEEYEDYRNSYEFKCDIRAAAQSFVESQVDWMREELEEAYAWEDR